MSRLEQEQEVLGGWKLKEEYKDSKLFENSLMTLVLDNKETRLQKSINKIKDLLSRYFVGLVLQISVLFLIYTIGLLIIGVENAIVIAFLCALINLIPYLGPMIGGAIMIFLTMTSNLGESFNEVIVPTTLKVLVVIIIGQLIDNFISQPLIFSKSVKSHPLEIFLIIIIGGLLFGIVGMIVAGDAFTVNVVASAVPPFVSIPPNVITGSVVLITSGMVGSNTGSGY